MSELLIEPRNVVVPGEKIAQGMDFLPSFGSYRKGDDVYAARLGLLQVDGKVIKIIPLSGRYNPKRGDNVIGRVSEILLSGWRVEINCAYSAVLGVKDATPDFVPKGADLRQYFELDDYVITSIVNVTSQKLVDLSMKGPGLRKLQGGRIVNVSPAKVPRIIGKAGSMVSMIKNATNCKITVGQNGLVWVSGEPEDELLVIETINRIQEESHTSGLTDRIKEFLEERTGKTIEDTRGEQ